jgi:hypothetical protein
LSGESNVVRGVDAVVACRRQQAQVRHREDLGRAEKILEELGVTLNREKTRIVHIAQGFEFLGFKIQRGKGQFKLAHDRIKSKLNRQNLYAIPTQKSVDRFKDQIRALTKRRIPLRLGELIKAINPIIRGWGHYYCRPGQDTLPPAGRVDSPPAVVAPRQAVAERRLEEISYPTAACGVQASWPCLTDPFTSDHESPFMKAACGKTARAV